MYMEFWDSLSLLKRLYAQCLEPVCRQWSLTRMELDILLFLANNPEFDTATDIIERRHLTKSHVSVSIRKLQEKGFLERLYDPGNRKTIHLKLTALSQSAVDDGQMAQKNFFSAIYRNFSQEEIQQIGRFVQIFASNIRAALGEE